MQMQGAYTLAKSIDTGSTSVQAAFTNAVTNMPAFDSHFRRALSDFDVRHNLVISATWEMASYRSGLKPVDWCSTGWQLGSIISSTSGPPFTVTVACNALGLNSNVPFDFPDRLNTPGCGSRANPGNPNAFIKLSCFAVPFPATGFVNAGRNVAIGPGLINRDASLVKNNHISRIVLVQFFTGIVMLWKKCSSKLAAEVREAKLASV